MRKGKGQLEQKIFADTTSRSAIASIGPLGAPILSGYVSTKLGWRAVFWRVPPVV